MNVLEKLAFYWNYPFVRYALICFEPFDPNIIKVSQHKKKQKRHSFYIL